MKFIKVFIFFILFGTICGTSTFLITLYKDGMDILSPIPDQSFARVLGEKTPQLTPTATPTLNPTPTLTPTPEPTLTPTITPYPTPIPITSSELEDYFTKYSSEYSIDKELLKRIAYCESRFNPNASTNLYAGLFQFSEPLWISTRTLMGQESDTSLRFNAEESIQTAAFMVSQGHLGIWPNCSK